jgi:hypothetical protein
MWMQIVAGAAWLLWLSSGTAGLEKGLTVGALLVLGLGLKNILDTFWKHKSAERQVAATSMEVPEISRFADRNIGFQSTSRWNNSRTDRSTGHPALRGFERRFEDPGA